MDPGAYCRDVESYLCRHNDGHLVRIVGPAFELVCGWAARGIPLSVVHRGIDRATERQLARPGNRRPLRIEFCEADVLDVHDEWRRAVGVAVASDRDQAPRPVRRRPSLAAHLEQAVNRLTAWRDAPEHPSSVAGLTDTLVRELELIRTAAKTVRGAARERVLARLAEADEELLTALRAAADDTLRARLERDAERDLESYRERLPADAYREAVRAGSDRLLREHFKPPRLVFD